MCFLSSFTSFHFSLPFFLFSFPATTFLFAAKQLPLMQLGIWESNVSSDSGVRGKAQELQMHFWCILSSGNVSAGCKCCFVSVEQNLKTKAKLFILDSPQQY